MVDKSGWDLREQFNDDKTFSSFSQLISGKVNYKTIREKKQEPIFCSQCKTQLKGKEKFCPECGNRVEIKLPEAIPHPEPPKSL